MTEQQKTYEPSPEDLKQLADAGFVEYELQSAERFYTRMFVAKAPNGEAAVALLFNKLGAVWTSPGAWGMQVGAATFREALEKSRAQQTLELGRATKRLTDLIAAIDRINAPMSQPEVPPKPTNIEIITGHLESARSSIKAVAAEVNRLRKGPMAPHNFKLALDGHPETGEVVANITLAYRHLEDASMRLGKAIQAANGGSVYDKARVVDVKDGLTGGSMNDTPVKPFV